jgi:hypothetical protein
VVAPRHTRLADFMHRAVDGADNWCIKPCLNVPSAIKRHLGLGWRWAKRVIVNPLYEKIMRNQNVVAYVYLPVSPMF